jgi:acyl-[acyl-carrier-protein] desaturase
VTILPLITGEIISRLYFDFLETAENKRRWNIFNDIPWDELEVLAPTETNAQCIEIFCSEELYFPDYSSRGLDLVRSRFGMTWFHTRWAFEESQHGLAFREYLTRSGLRSEAQCAALETNVLTSPWVLPFATARQMECYGALQESATYTAYRMQKDRARDAGDKVLEAIFFYVARDEAAHGGFYRALVELELAQDREGTIADLAYVLTNFKMPGDGLIPNYRERLNTSGAGISPRTFLERVIRPFLTTLAVGREELRHQRKSTRHHSQAAPTDSLDKNGYR